MPRIAFNDLPDDARLWVFPVPDPLDAGEVRDLLGDVDAFLDGWAAHGAPLTGARHWTEDRFLLVGVDQRSVPPSGCSIDAMVRVLKTAEARTGKTLVGHGPLYLRGDDGTIRSVSRREFRDGVQEGRITHGTPVFDTTLTSVGAWREGQFEVAAGDSWHGPAFFG